MAKIEKKVFSNPLPIALLWIAIMAWPAFFVGVKNGPGFIALSFGSIFALIIVGGLWYNYINKK